MVLGINLMHNMKKNLFQKARLKLTFYYVSIMFVILAFFSVALIYTIESKIRIGLQDNIVFEDGEADPLEKTSDEIELIIYSIDGVLLLLITLLSYTLAHKTLKPIKEVLDSQEKFLGDASHDLRTPIAIMQMESEVALKNTNACKQDYELAIKSNLDEIKSMSRLVDDLLLVSKNNYAIDSIQYEYISVYDSIVSITTSFKKQIERKKLELLLPESQNISLRTDIHQFRRVILNILENAIKYTDTGIIKIDIRETKNSIEITIKDNGIGIAPKDVPFVFDRFYKAEHSRSDLSGSGLGLSIVARIMDQLKGSITLESEEGVGTSVTLIFPKNSS